jgi:hypothetical protein
MIDCVLAENNKNVGILMSEEAAKDRCPGWSEQAYALLIEFKKSASKPFLAEEAREYAHAHGLPKPASERAWGAVIRRAAQAKEILFHGYAKTSNPLAHRTPASVWQKNQQEEAWQGK